MAHKQPKIRSVAAIAKKVMQGLRIISSHNGLLGGIHSFYQMIKSNEEGFVLRRI